MAPLLAIAALLAAPAAWELSLRSEARGRPAWQGEISRSVVGDVDLSPKAGVTASVDALQLSASYSPHLHWGLPAPKNAQGPDVVHAVGAGGRLRLTRQWNVGLRQSFALGTQTFSLLAARDPSAPGTGVPDRPPPVRGLPYLFSDTVLEVDGALAPRLRLLTSASWAVSGGSNAQARAYLPISRTATGSTSLTWTQDHRDAYSLSLRAARQSVPQVADNLLLDSGLGWLHTFNTDTRAELDLGLSVVRSRPAFRARGQPSAYTKVGPSAVARLVRSFRREQVALNLMARLAPSFDQVTGSAYTRAEGSGGVLWTLLPSLRVSASAGLARSISAPPGQSLSVGQGDLSVGWAVVGSQLALAGGVRGAYLLEQAPTVEPRFQWLGYVGFTLAQAGRF